MHPRPAHPCRYVVGMVSEGMAEAEILNAYPDLEVEDVREALRYAAEAVRERGTSRCRWFLKFLVDNALSALIAEGLRSAGGGLDHRECVSTKMWWGTIAK